MIKTKQLYFISLCVIIALGGFLFGFDTAVISGTLLFIVEQFNLNAVAEGWFVSSALLGSIIGAATAGFLTDFFGRRKTLIFSAILFGITAIGCMLAGSSEGLILFRLVGGLGIGIASIASPMYLSEISPPSKRGMVVSLYQMAITIGILTIYFSNYYFLGLSENPAVSFDSEFMNSVIKAEVWRSMFGAGIVPAFLFLILLLIIPESPRWLIKNGRIKKAQNALLKMRTYEATEKELNEIISSLGQSNDIGSKIPLKKYIKPIIIGVVFAFLVQFSGITAVIYYGAKILSINNNALDSAFKGQMLIGVVNVVFTLFAIFFIDKLGRRPLIIGGAVLSLVCHFFIGLLFFLGNNNSPLLIFFILLYTATFAGTYGPVFWTLISEIYPNRIRGKAMSIAAFANWIATALVSQMVPWMLENLKPHGTFWTFALLSIPAIYLGVKVIPETKNRSLEDLEKYWMKNE